MHSFLILRSRSTSAYELETAVHTGRLVQRITTALRSAFQSLPDLNQRKIYINSSTPRGYALIINNYQFEDGEVRHGFEVDVQNMTFLLDQLGYIAHENTNKTAQAPSIDKRRLSGCPSMLAELLGDGGSRTRRVTNFYRMEPLESFFPMMALKKGKSIFDNFFFF
uniref:Caspase family p20 domain-containing protein n=1 Tax=Globodera rostochiensis TaxID=31243 RepID=A0A914H9H2_GLORO